MSDNFAKFLIAFAFAAVFVAPIVFHSNKILALIANAITLGVN